MLFGKPKSFLGIDIGSGGVKVVELKLEKKRPVLFTYGYTNQPVAVHQVWDMPRRQMDTGKTTLRLANEEDKKAVEVPKLDSVEIQRLAEIVTQVCKEAKTVSREAVVGLPVSAVFHAVVSLPKVAKKDFDAILKAEVRKLLPYPLEQTSLDYQILPSDPESKVDRVLVNAVPRALVAFYTSVFVAAGLKLVALETEAAALTRSLVGRDTALTMLVDMGAERTNFFLADNAVPVTHQSIELGGMRVNSILQRALGVDPLLVEGMKQDLFSVSGSPGFEGVLNKESFLAMCMPLIEPIAKEIGYGFEVYLRQSGNENKRLEKIVLTGGAARFPYLAEYLSDEFKTRCFMGDPWGRVVYPDSLKPVLHAIGPRLSVAIGLALRSMV